MISELSERIHALEIGLSEQVLALDIGFATLKKPTTEAPSCAGIPQIVP